MKYLLDTHTLLFWLFDSPKLSSPARSVIAEPTNRLLVSSASAWEIATKYRIGKLDSAKVLVKDMPFWIAKAGFEELPISIEHAELAGGYANPHRDPFDRMLAAQAELEDIPLITNDNALKSFGVRTIW